jgi:hypothetical protein
MHCTIMFLAHTWLIYMLDYAELESEIPTEQARAENFTNLALDQGKPRYITPLSLIFVLN